MSKFPSKPVFIIDDEEQFLYSIGLSLRSNGITNVLTCLTGAKAREYISTQEFSVIVLDINLPDISGTELLGLIMEQSPETPVIMISAINQAEVAVDCIKKGAVDYLVKPFDESRMLTVLKNAIAQRELHGENEALKGYLLGSQLKKPEAFKHIVTKNSRMHSLFQYVEAIAVTPFPVLITGETGVGKDLFAQVIHKLSEKKGNLATVNVAGIDENTFSDTLFGHIKGAFTGAERARQGLIEQAAGGTLFLDEIGDLCNASQVKLLRVIQNRDYLPLGSDVSKLADVRIIVATNKTIDELKNGGQFRSDLFHRLRTHHIAIPPLRDRKDDISVLFEFFLSEACQILKIELPTVPAGFTEFLKRYDFPGNIRELKSMVFDAVSVQKNSTLSWEVFRKRMDCDQECLPPSSTPDPTGQSSLHFEPELPTIRQAVQALITEALNRSNGNQNAASRLLGITPQALSRRLKYNRAAIDNANPQD